jgi:S1-C subfamily serine protease
MAIADADAANFLGGFSNAIADLVEQAGRSVVAVHGRRRSISGIYWQPGVVVTADYGLKREAALSVTLADGTAVEAELAGRDPALDLVVLRLPDQALPLLAPSAGDLRPGSLAIALGRSADTGVAASLGLISSLSGPWRTLQGRTVDRYIRPDLSLYPTLLGGPLLDVSGGLIGINLSGPRSWPIAVPTETLERLVNLLLQTGQIAAGYIGVGLQPVAIPQNQQSALGLSASTGVLMVSLEAGGPADQAGLLIGDILLALGDQSVASLAEVQAALGAETVGQSLPVRLIRGGELIETTLVVGQRPAQGRC